jgi:hypothetical protein
MCLTVAADQKEAAGININTVYSNSLGSPELRLFVFLEAA